MQTAMRIGIENRGDSFALFVSLGGEPMHQFGPPVQLHIDGPFYVGISSCSHLPDKSDTAVLSNAVLENSTGHGSLTPGPGPGPPASVPTYSEAGGAGTAFCCGLKKTEVVTQNASRNARIEYSRSFLILSFLSSVLEPSGEGCSSHRRNSGQRPTWLRSFRPNGGGGRQNVTEKLEMDWKLL
jgi:hypothetical protein